jgi:hypothetical protein
MAGNRNKSISLRILLLTLFLAVQALGHAHTVDHVLDNDQNLCSICSVSGHSDAAVINSCESDVAELPHAAIADCHHPAVSRDGICLPDARAPPFS